MSGSKYNAVDLDPVRIAEHWRARDADGSKFRAWLDLLELSFPRFPGDIAAAASEAERLLLAMIRETAPTEWLSDGSEDPPVFYCPGCANIRDRGHSRDCAVSAARRYLAVRGLLK